MRLRSRKFSLSAKIFTFCKKFFFTKPHNMGVYGLAWTPAISFRGIRTPGAKFWVQGAFGPKFKNLHFCHKTPQYGCLWTRLDPSNQFSGDSDPCGRILGPRGFWNQIKKWMLLKCSVVCIVCSKNLMFNRLL